MGADTDEREVEGAQRQRVLVGEWHGQREDAVDPTGERHPLEEAVAVVRAAEVVEDDVVAGLAQDVGHAGDDGAEEPAGDERDDDRDGTGAARSEAGGLGRDDVGQLPRRVQHALAGLRSDLGLSAQGPGDGGGRDAGQGGDVENAGPVGRRLPPWFSAHDSPRGPTPTPEPACGSQDESASITFLPIVPQ